jgi:hypothetical protein
MRTQPAGAWVRRRWDDQVRQTRKGQDMTVKPLSEQLADLSARAKSAEDMVAEARAETQEKVAARRAQLHAATSEALNKVKAEVKDVGEDASATRAGLKAKVQQDLNHLKEKVAEKRHEHDVKRAERNAERLEEEATFAIDYAIASIENAKLAVIDAVAGRLQARRA